jgi:hypothetical protein
VLKFKRKFRHLKVKTKQLEWYRYVQRMEEGRLPKEVMKWCPREEENVLDLNITGRKG